MAHYIDVDSVVSNVQMQLGFQDDEMRPAFTQWAYDAQRAIGLSYLDKQDTGWRAIKDLSWDKPCGYIAPIEILVKDANGDCYLPKYSFKLDKCGCCSNVTQHNCDTYVSENNTQFYLDSDATDYTEYKMLYWGLPVDEGNNPLIREDNERAVIAYIEYMYTKRRRHQNRSEIPQSEVAYLYNQWKTLKGVALGKQNMPHKLLYEEAMRKWSTLVPVKHLNRYR